MDLHDLIERACGLIIQRVTHLTCIDGDCHGGSRLLRIVDDVVGLWWRALPRGTKERRAILLRQCPDGVGRVGEELSVVSARRDALQHVEVAERDALELRTIGAGAGVGVAVGEHQRVCRVGETHGLVGVHEAGDGVGVVEVGGVGRGAVERHRGADHEALVVRVLPPHDVARRGLDVVGHLVGRRVDHGAPPVVVHALGERQVRGVARERVQVHAGDHGPGVRGRGLLRVRRVPPDAARIRAAARRVPRGHDRAVQRLGRLHKGPLRRHHKVEGAQQRDRHPVHVVVVGARPAARRLSGVHRLDHGLDLAEHGRTRRARRNQHTVDHGIERLRVVPVLAERQAAGVRVVLEQVVLLVRPVLRHEATETLLGSLAPRRRCRRGVDHT